MPNFSHGVFVTERGDRTRDMTYKLPAGSYPEYDLTAHDGSQLPAFRPAFTPVELLRLGVFGRNYFGGAQAVPARDFAGLDPETLDAVMEHGVRPDHRPSWVANYYRVKAGMPYEWWYDKGMIFDEDPLGWFHWFCRFHAGRRHERDAHQIMRHQNFSRWAHDLHDQVHTHRDMSPIICQSLLHWSWHPADAASGQTSYV